MQGPYEQTIGSANPGFFVILIDQSSSMTEKFGASQKHIVAADAINKVLYEIRSAAREGNEIKDRCFVVVIGYGAETKTYLSHPVSQLASKQIRVEQRKFKLQDGSEAEAPMPIYLDPKAENGTPMDTAFDQAYNLAASFCRTRPESFPPIVINITDGVPNDLQQGSDGKRTREAASRLLTLKTRHGDLLLWNAHIGNHQLGTVLLPSDRNHLADHYAQYLFDFTSPIPKPMFESAQKVGFNPQPGARGLVFNADADALIRLLNFGSMPMFD